MTNISHRAHELIANPSPIVTGHIKCLENPYGINNPNGHLNFGIAQNHLMEEEILSFINNHHEFSNSDIHYNAGHGKQQLREAFVKFAKSYLNTPIMDPNLITVQNGVSALCESLAYCLFDEGETLLMPAPYYPGFIYDFSRRFKVDIKTVQLKKENDFRHNLSDFLEAIERHNPKAILLTHPYNPTGESLAQDFYAPLVAYCQKKNIHLITDEIYALTRLDRSIHHSLLSYDYENIHFLYGLAKDFTLAGLKIGFFYTRNKKLSEAMQAVSYFHTTSTQTQNTVTKLLLDDSFITKFIKTNSERIFKTYQNIQTHLPKLKHTIPTSGIFLWANFSHLLKENTALAEMDLFKFFIDEIKINMTPGQVMGMQEFGYFRVCYAKDENQIEEFIRRMEKVL
jgi:aspartate/methionine/tyrosine aminotransferase